MRERGGEWAVRLFRCSECTPRAERVVGTAATLVAPTEKPGKPCQRAPLLSGARCWRMEPAASAGTGSAGQPPSSAARKGRSHAERSVSSDMPVMAPPVCPASGPSTVAYRQLIQHGDDVLRACSPTPESLHVAKHCAPAPSTVPKTMLLLHVLFTILTTSFTRHVQPSCGVLESPHQPALVVEYHSPGNLRAVLARQHAYSCENLPHDVGCARLTFSVPTRGLHCLPPHVHQYAPSVHELLPW